MLRAMISGLTLGGIYALIALGLSLIFGVMDIINLAHGQLTVLGGYIAYWAFKLVYINPMISLPMVGASMACIGAALYILLIKRIREEVLTTLIVTYGFGIFLTDLMLFMWTADYRTIRLDLMEQPIGIGLLKVSIGESLSLILSLLLIIALYFLLTKTMIGKAIRATSQNRQAAALMGINTTKVDLICFCIGIALGGVAGTLFCTLYYLFPGLGGLLTTMGFVVTVLAGIGNIHGIIIGGVILGIAEMFTSVFIAAEIQHLVSFLVFMFALIVKHR